jgi:D-alanine-D-alanine ligase and related ATP-grasp enzymes
MKIAILYDEVHPDVSVDEEDNLAEADLAESVLSKKHKVIKLPFSADLQSTISRLKSYKPDLVFNLVESVCGSDVLSVVAVQLLEMLEIPFTGNKGFAQFITANKSLTKRILIDHDIPTPVSTFKPNVAYIMKSNTAHASAGLDDSCIMSFCTEQEMNIALEKHENHSGVKWMAEQYVDGREFDCAFLGDEMLPAVELCFASSFKGHKIRTYEAKWNEKSESYNQVQLEFGVDPAIEKRLQQLTAMCKKALMLSGYARIDFRMDSKGELYVIDVNTNPCISLDSSFNKMAAKAGIDMDKMFDTLIKCAKEEIL